MNMPAIHAICTGLMKVRRAQMESRGTGPARIAHMLLDEEWTRASRIVAPRPVHLGTVHLRFATLEVARKVRGEACGDLQADPVSLQKQVASDQVLQLQLVDLSG